MNTEPRLVTIRQVVSDRVSFNGMSSWYHVPPELAAVIAQACKQRREIGITFDRTALVSVDPRLSTHATVLGRVKRWLRYFSRRAKNLPVPPPRGGAFDPPSAP